MVKAGLCVAGAVVAGMLLLSGCSYHEYAGPFTPPETQGDEMSVADDGSVTFARGRLEVRLRPITRAELDRQFSERSQQGNKSTNPFTYGNTEFAVVDSGRDRFSVFELSVKNYAFPKVAIDPSRAMIVAQNGRSYWSLTLPQLETYHRAYAIGYRGNEYARYRQSLELLRRTLFKSEPVFSGQETSGYLVFPAIHPDVEGIDVTIPGVALRFDYQGEPVESTSVTYRFHRQIGRLLPNGTLIIDNNGGV